MRQVLILSLISLIPLFTVGCGSQQPTETSSTVPPETPGKLPTVAATPNSPTSKPAEDGAKVTAVASGLIPSTNAGVRSQSVPAGVRNDPFKGLATQPTIELSKEAAKAMAKSSAGKGFPIPPVSTTSVPTPSGGIGLKPSRVGGGGSQLPSQIASTTARNSSSNPTAGSGKQASTPAQAKPTGSSRGQSTTGKSKLPSAPPIPPSTELAKAVEITGVVQTNQSLVAIVRAPDEPTSRNVQAGERLSNGQVLVKRISVGIAGNPIVILEQNGVEVIRTLSSPSALG